MTSAPSRHTLLSQFMFQDGNLLRQDNVPENSCFEAGVLRPGAGQNSRFGPFPDGSPSTETFNPNVATPFSPPHATAPPSK